MAQQLDDCAHVWGNDLQLSPTGDLARAEGVDRSRQRVLRRLLTNPGTYLSHLQYGAGLPKAVGDTLTPSQIKSTISGQMQLEASVDRASPPTVDVSSLPDGVSASVGYVVAPEKQPVALSFDVSSQ